MSFTSALSPRVLARAPPLLRGGAWDSGLTNRHRTTAVTGPGLGHWPSRPVRRQRFPWKCRDKEFKVFHRVICRKYGATQSCQGVKIPGPLWGCSSVNVKRWAAERWRRGCRRVRTSVMWANKPLLEIFVGWDFQSLAVWQNTTNVIISAFVVQVPKCGSASSFTQGQVKPSCRPRRWSRLRLPALSQAYCWPNSVSFAVGLRPPLLGTATVPCCMAFSTWKSTSWRPTGECRCLLQRRPATSFKGLARWGLPTSSSLSTPKSPD